MRRPGDRQGLLARDSDALYVRVVEGMRRMQEVVEGMGRVLEVVDACDMLWRACTRAGGHATCRG